MSDEQGRQLSEKCIEVIDQWCDEQRIRANDCWQLKHRLQNAMRRAQIAPLCTVGSSARPPRGEYAPGELEGLRETADRIVMFHEAGHADEIDWDDAAIVARAYLALAEDGPPTKE